MYRRKTRFSQYCAALLPSILKIPFKPKKHNQGVRLNFEGFINRAGFAQGVFHKSVLNGWQTNQTDGQRYIQISVLKTSCLWILFLYSNLTEGDPNRIYKTCPYYASEEIQVAFRQNWERAANRTAINKHKECQGCQSSKWNGSVWAEGFLINSSALWGRDGLHSIKAKAVGPLLHTRHNTQPHPLWKSHEFPLFWLWNTSETSIITEITQQTLTL